MKPKAFTLIELLVVIAIIGLLSTIVLISTKGLTDRAKEVRKLSNRRQAIVYCTANPGFQVIAAPNPAGDTREYHVYCDSKGNMWSETLHIDMNTDDEVKIGGKGTGKYWYGADTFDSTNLADGLADKFRWSGTADGQNHDILVAPYISNKGKINDCNEVPTKYLHLFPACNVCAGLNYAGFSEGWRLSSQRLASHNITTNCEPGVSGNYCPASGTFCAPNRQLWDFGMENCNWDPNNCEEWIITDHQPSYDRKAVSGYYWSATQSLATYAWTLDFSCANVNNNHKFLDASYVRCFLGQWP